MLVAVDCVVCVFWVFEVMADHDCGLELEALVLAVQSFGRKEERSRTSKSRIL